VGRLCTLPERTIASLLSSTRPLQLATKSTVSVLDIESLVTSSVALFHIRADAHCHIAEAFSDIGIELQTMAASFDSGKGKVTSKALAVRKLATKQLDRAVLSWKEVSNSHVSADLLS